MSDFKQFEGEDQGGRRGDFAADARKHGPDPALGERVASARTKGRPMVIRRAPLWAGVGAIMVVSLVGTWRVERRLENQVRGLVGEVGQLDLDRLEDVDQRLDDARRGLAQPIEQGLADVHRRIDDTHRRIDDTDRRLGDIDAKIADVRSDAGELQNLHLATPAASVVVDGRFEPTRRRNRRAS